MLNPHFRDMLSEFNAAGVEYLIVGGYALAHHGYPRATGVLFDEAWREHVASRVNSIDMPSVLPAGLLRAHRWNPRCATLPAR